MLHFHRIFSLYSSTFLFSLFFNPFLQHPFNIFLSRIKSATTKNIQPTLSTLHIWLEHQPIENAFSSYLLCCCCCYRRCCCRCCWEERNFYQCLYNSFANRVRWQTKVSNFHFQFSIGSMNPAHIVNSILCHIHLSFQTKTRSFTSNQFLSNCIETDSQHSKFKKK